VKARCTLGFAPHSGWAAVVAVGGTATHPRVLARERLEMSDAALAGSRQPYHAIEELPPGEAAERLAAFEASAAALATEAIGVLVRTARTAGVEPRAAGILDSSGRRGATLAAILASHALIHTADGQHFREALARGCAALALPVTRIRARDLPAQAARALKRTPRSLAAAVAQLGRELPPPWGADQKSAALLGWLLLARRS
jgi:hypothetical protein